MSKFSIEALQPGYRVYYPHGSENFVYIHPTANAWWSDQAKVSRFLSVIGIDGTIQEACYHTGITLRQYKYFVKLHPEFVQLRKAYAAIVPLMARRQIANSVSRDSKVAMWLLERKHPEEFSLPAIRKNRGLREWEQNQNRSVLTPEQSAKLDMLANRALSQFLDSGKK